MRLSTVIAFHERESEDPITGAPGILRREWRIVPFNPADPLHLSISPPMLARGLVTVVLEQRYIRRGSIEPWHIFDAYLTITDALSDIDPRAIPIDCPALVWIQHDRIRIERERAAEVRAERDKSARIAEEEHIRGLSIDAWHKLYNNPRYRPLCDEWNEFTSRPSALALKDDLKSDTEFMRLYTYAHRGATTSITERQAIRACLDYYNFMWRHRESQYEPQAVQRRINHES